MHGLDEKIIDFTMAQSAAAGTACPTCGAAVPMDSVCVSCAVGLIDLALSSVDTEESGAIDLGWELSPSQAVQKFYDHYEVCMSASGVPVELGRGAMGITYKAIDMHLGCPVALKIVNARSWKDSAAAKRLLKEARAAAHLRHPNIASIHHLGLSDEKCYYSMEYIEGETLEAFIRRSGPLPVEVALEIVVQTSRALRVAHDRQFIHRDIKPTNIMLMRCGDIAARELVVKVIDFGLVKAIAEERGLAEPSIQAYFAGTPCYASPEQLQAGNVDARSDIYSLGVCLWYMLAGCLPVMPTVTTLDRMDRFRAALSLDLITQPLPPSLGRLLRSMVATDPHLRPQTAADLLDRASTCLAEVRRTQKTHGRLTARQRSARIAAVIAGAVLLVLAWWGARDMSTSKPSTSADNSPAQREARILCDEGNDHVSKLTRLDNQRAAELFSQALARSKDFADAYAGLAAVHFQNVARYGGPASELDLATENAQRAISLGPSRPRGYHALGNVLTLQGKPWAALAQLRNALEVDSQYLPGIRQFGSLWVVVGQPHMGMPWLKLASRMAPANPAVLCAAAEACVDLRLDEEAVEHYRRCLEVVPTSLSAHCGLIHIHLLEGNFAQANKDYDDIQSLAPEKTVALALKAQLELFQGNHQEAERVYRVLLTQNRTGNVTYFGGISYLSALGYLRLLAGDHHESEVLLAEAEGLHLESEGAHGVFDLAAIRAIQGRKAEALSALRQAVASGWLDYRTMKLDPRFESLRSEPEFHQIIESLAHRVELLRAEAEKRCLKPPVIADYPVQPGSI